MAGILLALGENLSENYNILHDKFMKIKKLNNSNRLINNKYCISKFSRANEKDDNIIVSDDNLNEIQVGVNKNVHKNVVI